MRFAAALLREQGVRFAIVVVRPSILRNMARSGQIKACFGRLFSCPVVLMSQDSRGTPTFRGRQDLVWFLSSVPLRSVPWRKFTLPA